MLVLRATQQVHRVLAHSWICCFVIRLFSVAWRSLYRCISGSDDRMCGCAWVKTIHAPGGCGSALAGAVRLQGPSECTVLSAVVLDSGQRVRGCGAHSILCMRPAAARDALQTCRGPSNC